MNLVEGERTGKQKELIDQKPTIKIDDSYKNKRGYFRSETGKLEKYQQFKQKLVKYNDFLDLDCVNHQEGKIRLHTWVSEQEMQLQLNETIQKMKAENYLNLLIYNTTEIVLPTLPE